MTTPIHIISLGAVLLAGCSKPQRQKIGAPFVYDAKDVLVSNGAVLIWSNSGTAGNYGTLITVSNASGKTVELTIPYLKRGETVFTVTNHP